MQVGADPLSREEFAALMARLGPFEHRPRLAVAVSGGPDSLALVLLAHDWARECGGSVLALGVDHGLRTESALEMATLSQWMARDEIACRILVWNGPKPTSGIQAAARNARHALLAEACREEGILHLLLAHHRDDQAETLLIRLGRGSGVDGLAAMQADSPRRWGRLLRPLLAIPKVRLEATLRARGREWLVDPGNSRLDQTRGRLRALMPLLAKAGIVPDRLAATAGRMARARAGLEAELASLAARWVHLDRGGFVRLGCPALDRVSDELRLRLLARLLGGVGGGGYPPRIERLERLLARILAGQDFTATLSGCRVTLAEGMILVTRESARMAPPVALMPGCEVVWDDRLLVRLGEGAPSGLRLGGLGLGWRIVSKALGRACPAIPAAARAGIPALWDRDGVCAVPRLGYNRDGSIPPPLFLEWAPVVTLT